jgi:hypothetical protein
MLAAACERADEERRTDKDQRETPPPTTEDRRDAEAGIQWAGTYDNALKMARESSKPVMVITVAEDNEDSRVIENELLTHARVQDLSKQFINVKLDAGKDENLPEDVRDPGQIVFLGWDGKKIDSYKGGDANALADKMDEVLKKNAELKDQGFAQPMQDDPNRPPDDDPQQPPPPSPQPPADKQPGEMPATQEKVWLRLDHPDAMKIAKDENKLVLHIECHSTLPKDQPQQMQDDPMPPEPKPEQEPQPDQKFDKNTMEHINLVILKDERIVKALENYVVMAIEKPMPSQTEEKKDDAQAAEVRQIRFVIVDADGKELKVVEEISVDALAPALEECAKQRNGNDQQEPGPKPEEPKAEPKEKVWVYLPWNEAMTRAKDQNKKVLLFVVQPGDAGFTAFHQEMHKDAATLEKLNEYVVIKVLATKDLAGLPADVKDRSAGKTTILILDADSKVMDTIEVNIDTFRMKLGVEKKNGEEPKKNGDQEQPKDQEMEPKDQEPAPGGAILWVLDKDEGMKRAKEENKPVMIVYLKENDPSTDQLMRTAFSDPKVIELSRKFIVIRQDIGLGHRHDGKEQGHVHFQDQDGKETASLLHIETTEKLIEVMNQALEGGEKK